MDLETLQRSKVRWLFIGGILLVGLLFWLVLLKMYSVDLPILDDWDLVWYVEQFQKGKMDLALLWRDYSGHRYTSSLPYAVVIAQLFSLNQTVFHVINVLSLVSLAGMTYIGLSGRPLSRGLDSCQPYFFYPIAVLIAVTFLGIVQHHAIFWSWQISTQLSTQCVLLGCLLSAIRVGKSPIWTLLVTVVLCVLATFSFGNGVLSWLACAIGFFIANDEKKTAWTGSAILGVLGTITFFLYRHGLGEHSISGAQHTTPMFEPWPLIHFIGHFLGFVYLPASYMLTFVLGFLSLIAFIVLAGVWFFKFRRSSCRRASCSFFIAAGTYSVLSAALIGVFRAVPADHPLFIYNGGDSRYSIFSYFHWFAIFVLAYDLLCQLNWQQKRVPSGLLTLSICALICLSGLRSVGRLPKLVDDERVRRQTRDLLLANKPLPEPLDEVIALHRYTREEFFRRDKFLKENKLSYYREK
jgi:hypothetical protein